MHETGPTRVGTSPRTFTFLFTDIEGSTRLWEEQREAMAIALEAHDSLLRAAVERSGGNVVKSTGDGMLASFDRPEAALTAAIDAQLALDAHQWPGTRPVRVRMAVHSGSANARDGDFFGPALNRAARLLAIGHGGQVLASGTTASLAADDLPPTSELIDLGEHRLRDLDRPEHIYQLSAPGLRREFPPLRTTSDHPTNLRPQVTSFVGREEELANVLRLLAANRLVTLVGVGGTGKTRLALQAAGDALDGYRDGVWLVELAPLSDPELLVAEIGRALRAQQQAGQPPIDTIVDYLRSKDMLLLLDNCEHLIGTVAEVTDRLLGSCPALKVLTTSREPLDVGGEALVAVPSLTLPPAMEEYGGQPVVDADAVERTGRSEAVALFVERARATLPGFTLDQSNVGAVVEICRRLDGIPLAIELAAARINVLSADEIAQGLGDRFRLLTGGRRTAVPRQRTLQALIDWSWDLLDDADRRLLRRLAVFSGGWTLDAAAAVTADLDLPAGGGGPRGSSSGGAARITTLDGLGRLVDRSLIAVDHTSATRYRMLETIRQYAADQLAASGETAALRDRHLGYYRRLAHEAESGLAGSEMAAWMARLDAEIDNLRTALDWAGDGDPEAGLEMGVAMTRYWRSRTMGPEGRDRLLAAVARVRALPEPEAMPARRARLALAARALSAAVETTVMGLGANASSLAEEALALARESGDPAAIADALYVSLSAANPMATSGRLADWRAVADEALAIATDLGDWGRVGQIASSVAMIEVSRDVAAADGWLEQASDGYGRSHNPQAMAYLAQVRGRVASGAGRLTDAQQWFRESEARFEAIGDRRFALSAQSELAHALRRDGRLENAETQYRQTIRGWQQSGNRGAVAHQLESIAFLALARGRDERAACLLSAAEALREVAGAPMTAFERAEYDAAVSRLRGALDTRSFGETWATGRSLTADEAVAVALGD